MKKLISALTALLVLASAASCGSGADGKPEVTAARTENAAAQVTEAETTDPHLDSLPADIDLGGMDIRMFGGVEQVNENELSVEEMNGEVINDAIFTRQLSVEQRLNVKIKPNIFVQGGDASGTLKKTVKAGSDEFDVYLANSYQTFPIAADGMFIDLYTVPALDFEKPYWSDGFIETASINGRLYLVTGPMSLGFYRYLMINVFNKNMFERAGIEMPYKAVLDGKWTLDMQNSIASQFYADLNGDGTRDAGDQYGFVTRAMSDTSINDGYWSSLNLRTISKDESGYYIMNIDVDTFASAIDHLLALMKGDGTDNMCDNDDDIYKRFSSGLSAMSNGRLHVVESGEFRDMEDDYGLLPMAKATEAQDRYYTLAQDQVIVYGIPLTVPEDRTESIGVFLEAFASESYATVKPAYYEIALTEKYMNDEESKQMLNLITDSLYIDPAILYLSMSPINVNTLRTLLSKGENNIASTLAKQEKSMQKFIDRVNKAYGSEG